MYHEKKKGKKSDGRVGILNFILLYFHSALLKTTLHDIGHLYKELHYYYYSKQLYHTSTYYNDYTYFH